MEEVDDLSDTDKVSLISDIDLKKPSGSVEDKDNALNLKNIKEINKSSQIKVNNGIKLSN